jgi:hypothetical protein
VQHSVTLGAAPSFLAVSGSLEAGYRLSATTRDGRLHTLRGGEAAGPPVQLEAHPVGLVSRRPRDWGLLRGSLCCRRGCPANSPPRAARATTPAQVRIGQAALVGTMADAVHCYAGKAGAARQYSLPQPAAILCMTLLATHTSRMTKGLIVALASGEVRVYNERCLVSVHTTAGAAPAMGLAFGRYAREDNTLVTITRGGGLDIKVWVARREVPALGDALLSPGPQRAARHKPPTQAAGKSLLPPPPPTPRSCRARPTWRLRPRRRGRRRSRTCRSRCRPRRGSTWSRRRSEVVAGLVPWQPLAEPAPHAPQPSPCRSGAVAPSPTSQRAFTPLHVSLPTQREREGAVDMHHRFQRDLVRARLATARALHKVLTDGQVRRGQGRAGRGGAGRGGAGRGGAGRGGAGRGGAGRAGTCRWAASCALSARARHSLFLLASRAPPPPPPLPPHCRARQRTRPVQASRCPPPSRASGRASGSW